MDEPLVPMRDLKKAHHSVDWWASLKAVRTVASWELKRAVKLDGLRDETMADEWVDQTVAATEKMLVGLSDDQMVVTMVAMLAFLRVESE